MHTPSYLLRRHVVLRILAQKGPQQFLEIGCGRGDLLAQLAARGWEGTGLEIAPHAARTARRAVERFGSRISVVENPERVRGEFPVVLALEVLEHLADDAAELRRWRDWVAPDGRLILTVPAHQRYWTRADEYGGHVRRYERESLRRLVTESGFVIETFWSFGFPLTALTIPLRQLAYRRRLARVNQLSRDERVLASSFDSTRNIAGERVFGVAVEAVGTLFHWLQLPFLRSNLGASFLVECRRLS